MDELDQNASVLDTEQAAKAEMTARAIEEVEAAEAAADIAPARKGYQNPTARLLNVVYWVFLVIMVVFLALQVYLNVGSYLQQGADIGIALLYTSASLAVPLLFCIFPFLIKFFAEIVEILDRKNS